MNSIIHSVSNPSGDTNKKDFLEGHVAGIYSNSMNIAINPSGHLSIVTSRDSMSPESILLPEGLPKNLSINSKVFLKRDNINYVMILSNFSQLVLKNERYIDLFVNGETTVIIEIDVLCDILKKTIFSETANKKLKIENSINSGIIILKKGIQTGNHYFFQKAGIMLGGLGEGFTPTGDDILAGAMASHIFFRQYFNRTYDECIKLNESAALSAKTSWPSSIMLLRAALGGCPLPAKDLFSALNLGDVKSLQIILQRLSRLGHSSGKDFIKGISTVLNAVTMSS